MLSSNTIYDISERISEDNIDAELCRELLDEIQRLKSFITDIIDFRHSKEHDIMMDKLESIHAKVRDGC